MGMSVLMAASASASASAVQAPAVRMPCSSSSMASASTKPRLRVCYAPPRMSSARVLSTQHSCGRETLSSSFAVRALGDTTIAPSRSTEKFSSNNTESKDMAVSEECREDPGKSSTMVRVCDKLIEVFMVDKPTPTDWRRLLAFSKTWCNIRPHFYKRCQERADTENDPGIKHNLLRLGRKLKEIDDDLQRHDELLQVIKESPDEIGAIVVRRRKDFTKEFFVHVHNVAQSYYDDPSKQSDIARLGDISLAAVQAYDNASQSIEALNAAELKFKDILSSPTVDAACRKIDKLAEKKDLDSALMLMITKAWSAAKETSMMKEEAKDILYHLYKTAVGNAQRQVPKDIRILKYLLTIEDPEEQLCALRDAFTPGFELEGNDVDYLYTTPEKLHTWITTVVDAYHFSREGTLIREARDLMNPKIVQRLEGLKKLMQDNFL